MNLRFSNKLKVEDFRAHPVWEFTNNHEHLGIDGELVVEPVRELPVTTLEGRFIGIPVTLANKDVVFGVLLNVHLEEAKPPSSIIIYQGDGIFLFRRSLTGPITGPEQLASFLGLRVEDIFPISYDISPFAVGVASVINGKIPLDALKIPDGMSQKDFFKQVLEARRTRREKE